MLWIGGQCFIEDRGTLIINPWYSKHLETVHGNKQKVRGGIPLLCSGLGDIVLLWTGGHSQ
jgi:hypothetical protein